MLSRRKPQFFTSRWRSVLVTARLFSSANSSISLSLLSFLSPRLYGPIRIFVDTSSSFAFKSPVKIKTGPCCWSGQLFFVVRHGTLFFKFFFLRLTRGCINLDSSEVSLVIPGIQA